MNDFSNVLIWSKTNTVNKYFSIVIKPIYYNLVELRFLITSHIKIS
jgi:hypothetical protein